MSIKTLGESINIGVNNTITKNINLSTGSNITFASGTTLDINGSVYFPHSSNVNIGDNTTTLQSILSSGIPTGGIMIWSGTLANKPAGWAICDGTSGTPNLTNLFVIGTNAVKTVVGGNTNNQVAITTENLPLHSHTGRTPGAGVEHAHGIPISDGGSGTNAITATDGQNNTNARIRSTGINNHLHSISTLSTGGSGSINIIPPYYALYYIMKL